MTALTTRSTLWTTSTTTTMMHLCSTTQQPSTPTVPPIIPRRPLPRATMLPSTSASQANPSLTTVCLSPQTRTTSTTLRMALESSGMRLSISTSSSRCVNVRHIGRAIPEPRPGRAQVSAGCLSCVVWVIFMRSSLLIVLSVPITRFLNSPHFPHYLTSTTHATVLVRLSHWLAHSPNIHFRLSAFDPLPLHFNPKTRSSHPTRVRRPNSYSGHLSLTCDAWRVFSMCTARAHPPCTYCPVPTIRFQHARQHVPCSFFSLIHAFGRALTMSPLIPSH